MNKFKKTTKIWFKKNWFLFTNYVVIFLAYLNVCKKTDAVWAHTLLALWIMFSIGYATYKWLMEEV